MSAFESSNPLLCDWELNYGLPPFEKISPNHFENALNTAMEEHLKEVHAISTNPDSPTFVNTILALEDSGSLFNRINDCFSNMCSSVGTPELQVVELKMTTAIASHYNKITTYPGLFERVDEVYQKRHNLGLNDVQVRLVERYHLDAVKSGAKFNPEQKQRYAEIVEEIASLQTQFTQNVMKDEAEIYLELNNSSEDLAGLPEDLITAAKQAALQRSNGADNVPDAEVKPIITLSRSLVEPFLTYSENRELREKAWKLWTRRGELHPERDNLKIAK